MNDMTPTDVERIVHDYGAVLEEKTALGVIRDVHSLPHPKNKIKDALRFALGVTKDKLMREHLRAAYISLSDFQELSDAQVGALQKWNRALTNSLSDRSISELQGEAAMMSEVGEMVVAVQRRSTAEAEFLLKELKVAGL
jgi:hypothetical protein